MSKPETTVRPRFTHNENEAWIHWINADGRRVYLTIDTEDMRFVWVKKSISGKWEAGGDEPWPDALMIAVKEVQE